MLKPWRRRRRKEKGEKFTRCYILQDVLKLTNTSHTNHTNKHTFHIFINKTCTKVKKKVEPSLGYTYGGDWGEGEEAEQNGMASNLGT